jgi:hypothetical protein
MFKEGGTVAEAGSRPSARVRSEISACKIYAEEKWHCNRLFPSTSDVSVSVTTPMISTHSFINDAA